MIGAVLAMAIAAFHAELAARFTRRGDEVAARSSARWATVLAACSVSPSVFGLVRSFVFG